MKILHTVKKGKMMDTLERFHIYKDTKLENQINDRNTITQNILFDMIIQKSQVEGIPNNRLSQNSSNRAQSQSSTQPNNRLTTKTPIHTPITVSQSIS